MTDYVETLNNWGENVLSFAWPMLWQSSLLIAIVFAFDWLFARRIRASIRYTLWLVVLVKLILPPALALPTGATWWLWRAHPTVESPVIQNYTVSFGNTLPNTATPPTVPMVLPAPKLELNGDAWVLLATIAIGAALLLWLAFRWLRVAANVRRAATAPAELDSILDEARQLAGLRRLPRLRLIDDKQSPAVYGLFRPVILLPRTLAGQLSVRQLRAVLLHEAVHLRRGDVWMNFAQTLLQIAYWWHPLLWLANARIRRAREEAVDDAVMLALHDGADAYAPTLLEVAKFAFHRPLANLGLVGILESRSALRQRVERLMDFRPPRKAGITVLSLFGIFAFSAVALPMGQGPAPDETPAPSATENAASAKNQDTSTHAFLVQKPVSEKKLQQLLLQAGVKTPPTVWTYLKDGRLLARGTDDQLDNIRRVVLKLDGISSNNIHGPSFLIKRGATRPQDIQVYTSANRKALLDKLKSIHLDVSYKNEPLNQVLRDLAKRSRELAPDKKGINFLFNPNVDSVVYTPAGLPEVMDTAVPRIDPATGLPTKTDTSPRVADDSRININLHLNNVNLADVLSAICMVSDQPIEYSIQDWGVVFSAKDTNAVFYEVRTFKVNPDIFYSNLKDNVANAEPPNYLENVSADMGNVSALAKAFFLNQGVNLDPPKSVFFTDRQGVLFVYATPQDLDVVKKAVQTLNSPVIDIKARFIEVPKSFLTSAVTKSSFPGLTNGTILPSAEFNQLLYKLESQNGSKEVGEPEVLTLSTRQCQMRCTTPQLIITNFTFKTSADAVAGAAKPYGNFPDGSAFVPQTEPVETGPILDVVPDLLADNYNTINLTTIASHIDFLGYSSSHGLVPNVTTNDAGTGFSPVFQVGEALMIRNLWDGQTLVLFPKYKVLSNGKTKDRISKVVEEKNRDTVEIVLVTATLVDKEGDRIHSDAELPFAQKGVPPQSL